MLMTLLVLWAWLLTRLQLRTNAGADLQSSVMGGGPHVGRTGTATTAPTATTFTCDGEAFTTNALAGLVIVRAGVYGVILSNTATVLTIDKWYNPNDPGGAAAATPATGQWVLLPGGQPAWWMAVTENTAQTFDAAQTALTGELTSGGFQRALATWAHTASATNYTLTKTFTSSDGTTRTPARIGIFNAQNNGRMTFFTAIPSPPAMVSGDQITITETVSLV